MKSAREEFGQSVLRVEQKLSQNMRDLQTVRQLGEQLKQSGVTQEPKQANLTLVKNEHVDHAGQKNLGVSQGDRPALSPCDGRLQAEAKQAGQTLQNAGVSKSAAQSFSGPTQTPSAPTQAQGQGRSR